MADKTASEEIDNIIQTYGGWKGDMLARVRTVVLKADPEITEETKWKMATRPEGLPTWVHDGIVCFAETWKDNIKLIFFNGAKITDTNKLFNARLNSSSVRAIELHDGDNIDEAGLKDLILKAVEFNKSKKAKS